MKHTATIALLLIGGSFFLASPTEFPRAAHAQSAPRCSYEQDVTKPQDVITACTATINARGKTPKDLARAYSNRCAALGEVGQPEKALADCTKAIELDPTLGEALRRRAAINLDLDQPSRSIADSTRAIQLDPTDYKAYNNRGNAYRSKSQYARAIQDYTQAIKLRPDFARAYYNRGIAYRHEGQHDNAIRDYTQAIKLKPDFPDAYSNRGIAHAAKGQYDRAIADFNKAISAPNRREPALDFGNRGYAYLKKGSLTDLTQAIADTERALRLDPNLPFVRDNLEEARRIKEALLAQAHAQSTGARVALVIGNAVYDNDRQIPNAANDANDVAKALGNLGYKVTIKTNLKIAGMRAELGRFAKSSIGADAAVVWYSGHGQQMREEGAENADDYVIPVDAQINRRADVAKNAIRVDTVTTAVTAAKQLRMVVIDACRNSRFWSETRGAARRNVERPGVLIIYSAQPGNVAIDDLGDGSRNSPFARAFLDALKEGPKRDVRLLFSDVVGRTRKLTNNDQSPQPIDGLATGDAMALAQ